MNVTLYKPYNVILANDQIYAQQFLIHLLQSSTCFEQHLAHLQEVTVRSLTESDDTRRCINTI